VGVVTIWLDTREQEQQVCDWLDERKSAKESRESAAKIIQLTWRYKKYKNTQEAQSGYRKKKHMRLETEAKQVCILC
jgi:hypothetical protein